MGQQKLFMILLGCKPPGRHTEQHDIFFGIGENLSAIKEDMVKSWPETKGHMHIDSWREVNVVDEFLIEVKEREASPPAAAHRLFFINLGGYKPGDPEEYHYKLLVVAADMGEAVRQARQTAFYKHTGFEGAVSHIDDKYGVDVDDVFEIGDVLPDHIKEKYQLLIGKPAVAPAADTWHIGYLKLDKI